MDEHGEELARRLRDLIRNAAKFKQHGPAISLDAKYLAHSIERAEYALRRFESLASSPSRPAVLDVIAERRRQVAIEGWTPEHDDKHSTGDLAIAAACYALGTTFLSGSDVDIWPWERDAWKPKDDRRNLVRAGALILAEIERLDRAAAPALGEGER